MEVTAKAHNTETMAEVKVNDQNTRSITSQNKTEIDALVKMLIARMSPNQLLAEIDRLNAEQQQYAVAATADISQGASPFVQPMQQ
jgi:ATP-dependent Zn protease